MKRKMQLMKPLCTLFAALTPNSSSLLKFFSKICLQSFCGGYYLLISFDLLIINNEFLLNNLRQLPQLTPSTS